MEVIKGTYLVKKLYRNLSGDGRKDRYLVKDVRKGTR
jgi:hypothetical protein